MIHLRRFLSFMVFTTWAVSTAAQELEPGAYSISPVGLNFLVVTNNFSRGDLTFDPTLPIEDAEATINTTAFAYVRTLDFMRRSANVGIVAPYTIGHLEGLYIGDFTEVDRSGFRDPLVRFAVNLVARLESRTLSARHRCTSCARSSLVCGPPST